MPAVHLDPLVLAFAAVVSVVTGLLFGLAPAWSMTRADLHTVLKQVSRSSTSGRRWLRSGLAAGELALATMLLIGAGLLGQTLLQLQRQPIGFAPDHLLTFQVSPPASKYPLDSKAPVFYASLIDALDGMPGVARRRGFERRALRQRQLHDNPDVRHRRHHRRSPIRSTGGSSVPASSA